MKRIWRRHRQPRLKFCAIPLVDVALEVVQAAARSRAREPGVLEALVHKPARGIEHFDGMGTLEAIQGETLGEHPDHSLPP